MNRYYVGSRDGYFVVEDDDTGDVVTDEDGRVLTFDLVREAEAFIDNLELEEQLALADSLCDPFDMHKWAEKVCGI